jgi:hypothetical protein
MTDGPLLARMDSMRPFRLLQLLRPIPGGHLLFRVLMLLGFAWRGVWSDLLARLTGWSGAPLPLLRWAVERRKRLLMDWHNDLVDLQRLRLELRLHR